MPFPLTCSRKVCFLGCKFLENHTGMQSFESLTKVIMFCKNRGFAIQHLLVDPELECLKTTMNTKHGTEVNPGSAKEHVTDMEQQTRAVQERIHSCFSHMPHKHKLRTLTECAVSHCAKWLNSFPCKGSCTPSVSPWASMTGEELKHNKHCKIEVGAYT